MQKFNLIQRVTSDFKWDANSYFNKKVQYKEWKSKKSGVMIFFISKVRCFFLLVNGCCLYICPIFVYKGLLFIYNFADDDIVVFFF